MVLDIGELIGRLRVDPRGMDEGLDQGESRFQRFGNKLTSLAGGLGLAAGAALFGGLISAMDQESIGAKIQAKLGLQGEAKQLGAMAGKLWAEGWGESAEAIGETMTIVAQANIVPDESDAALEDITRRAQILADVMGADVKGSVEAVQQMIRNGLVPDAASGFDLIMSGMQGGVDKAEDLNDTFVEYSTKFRDMGLSGAQAMGLMSQGLKAGARDADTVADAIKEFQIRATDGSTSSADAFKALGLNAQKMTAQFAKGGQGASDGLQLVLTKLKAMKDPAERNAAAVGLFGTKAEDLGQALFALDLSSAASEFDEAAGSIDRAGKAIGESDAAKLEKFKRQAQQAATSLMADLVPSLSTAGEWIKKNQGWLKPLVEILGGLAVAIVAVNLATKAWAATEAAFASIKAAATAAQWLWNASLYGFPVVWIIAAIIALIAIVVLIATKTTWFQDLWGWAWGGIKAAALAVWDWLKNTLWPWLKGMYEAHVSAVIAMKNGTVSAWNSVMSFLSGVKNFFSSVFSAIGDFIAAGFNRGRDAARGAVNSIIGFVNTAIRGLNTIIGAANKVPGVNIPSVGSIPHLAQGGVVRPSPGGTPVVMGDGRQVEYGVPEDRLLGMLARARGQGAGGGTTRIIVETPRGDVLRVVRTEVNAQGGDVQKVLGARR